MKTCKKLPFFFVCAKVLKFRLYTKALSIFFLLNVVNDSIAHERPHNLEVLFKQ